MTTKDENFYSKDDDENGENDDSQNQDESEYPCNLYAGHPKADPDYIPPDQRDSNANDRFSAALKTIEALLPFDDHVEVHQALEEIKQAFYDINTVANEYKEDAELYESLFDTMAEKRDAVLERCTILESQNSAMAGMIRSTVTNLTQTLKQNYTPPEPFVLL